MAGRNRRVSQEFKDEAVRMVLDGPRPVSRVAKELGIHDTTLGNWVNAYRRTRGDDVALARDVSEKKSERELALERENRKLREENEFLEKAAAFFAREQR
ncbi:transposase [Nonomuraea sp. NPDC004702]